MNIELRQDLLLFSAIINRELQKASADLILYLTFLPSTPLDNPQALYPLTNLHQQMQSHLPTIHELRRQIESSSEKNLKEPLLSLEQPLIHLGYSAGQLSQILITPSPTSFADRLSFLTEQTLFNIRQLRILLQKLETLCQSDLPKTV